MYLWGVAVVELDIKGPDQNCPKTHPINLAEHWASRPIPSIKYTCRADALRVMPKTQFLKTKFFYI